MGFFSFMKSNDINAGVQRFRETADAVLLDVRSRQEYAAGHIPGSRNLPLDKLEAAADEKHALTLNFLSAYFASDFPPAYAGKPAQTIRAFILERIGETEGALGVMVCDFMTSDLAHAIIGRNFQ